MGALIGIAIQMVVLAISLMITLVVWAVRLTMMLIGTLIAMASSERR
jgi:hypothetical protein